MSNIHNNSSAIIMNGALVTNRSTFFGERRNHLKAMWDVLFGDQPKEWIGFKPTLGGYVYPCYACRHMFSSLVSLQDHINRRVIVLKYNCYNCPDEDLTFYNRCSLLLHARSHFNIEEGQINLSEVNTFTLPLHLTGFLPIPEIPTLYENEEDVINDNVYINTQFYCPNALDQGKQVILLKPNDFIYREPNQILSIKQICNYTPKCQFITTEEHTRLKEQADANNRNIKVELFDYIDQLTLPVISKVESLYEKTFSIPECLDCKSVQDGTMAEHYLGSNKPEDMNLTCSICKFIASTKCSYQAHIRIHTNQAPHVCPDCGKDFEDADTLQKHLNEVCFHLAKFVKFRCASMKCRKLFASEYNLRLHFKGHCVVYKCSECSMKIGSTKSAEEHAASHKGRCTYSRVFHCSLCNNKGPKNEAELEDHVNLHTSGSNSGVYVYMCQYCRSYFRTTATFATHLLRCTSRKFVEKNNFQDCENCKNNRLCQFQINTGHCQNGNKRSSGNKKVILTKKFFCILCNQQIRVEDKPTHMRVCKYSRPMVLVQRLNCSDINGSFCSSDYSYNSNKSEGKRSFRSGDSPKSEENGKKKRKKSLNLRPRRAEKDMQPDLTAEKPVEFDGTYYCKLCDYKNSVRAEFHTHIRSHRDISTAYQCMECGECFVVKPSLNKHLIHFHNIADYQSYLKENDCYDVEAVKELENVMRLAPGESKEDVKENQCSVCLEEFEDSPTLKKHYRSHGMAFLLKNSK